MLLRKNGEINQTQVAKISGTSQANVSRWLKGEHSPHNDNIEKLAKALKLSPHQIRGETPIDFIDGVKYATNEDMFLFSQIAALPEDVKKLIREQVAVYQRLNQNQQ